MNPFTDQELQSLADQINLQLSELATGIDHQNLQKSVRGGKKALPAKQKALLEQATGEAAETFLKKFVRVAKQDLCREGGVLHGQWQKYGDLENESMLKHFGGILAGMGLTSAPLQTAVVAVSVIVLHLGIKAICEDCE
ncbi:MAG: hypothetical protein ACXV8O_08520 [Methylobacter sp.]